jgi:hypothetical protein
MLVKYPECSWAPDICAILLLCRQISEEVAKIFYSHFHFMLQEADMALAFFDQIGIKNQLNLRRLSLSMMHTTEVPLITKMLQKLQVSSPHLKLLTIRFPLPMVSSDTQNFWLGKREKEEEVSDKYYEEVYGAFFK